jgi:hypothetical protein
MNHYAMKLQWMEKDRFFLVTIPEFSDRVIMPCTHGKTRTEAIFLSFYFQSSQVSLKIDVSGNAVGLSLSFNNNCNSCNFFCCTNGSCTN